MNTISESYIITYICVIIKYMVEGKMNTITIELTEELLFNLLLGYGIAAIICIFILWYLSHR